MRRVSLILFILLVTFKGWSQDIVVNTTFPPYDDLFKMVKYYFRSDPYAGEFSSFLKHLLNDPTIVSKSISRKTDTSLFSFKGDYTSHSPFSFRAERTEIRLSEREFESNDSIQSRDTLIVYQLLGYSYGGKEGLEAVQKEFTKFNRKYGKHFLMESSDMKKKDEVVGSLKDYFIDGVPGSPLTVAWARVDDLQNVFVITLRLTVRENLVQLPLPIAVNVH